MSEQAKFLTGSLFKHVSVMSLTASVGLMAIFLVDFVDMIFISMLGKAELAAAVGYAGAILFFTTSFGIGMSVAAGALVARALGAGDEQEAKRKATHALIYGFVFGAIFCRTCLAKSRVLCHAAGCKWRDTRACRALPSDHCSNPSISHDRHGWRRDFARAW